LDRIFVLLAIRKPGRIVTQILWLGHRKRLPSLADLNLLHCNIILRKADVAQIGDLDAI